MNKSPRRPGHNVVDIAAQKSIGAARRRGITPPASRSTPRSVAGSANDPRMKEALRLAEAFLAIEDDTARAALIILAEQLVSHDWVGKLQGKGAG